jgi:GT2 family glycosyltransferase
MVDVVIGIPTYFGNKMLQNCVQSILQNVKNSKIFIFKNDIGWLQACNHILHNTTTDIILLNDDTFVITDIAQELYDVAYKYEGVGIVGGKSLAPNGETVINYGIHVSADGNTAHKYFGHPSSELTKVESQKAVEGSCMYIKREVIEKIGVFDERYKMGYRAEVDYGFRAREAGYKIVSAPEAKYIHFTSQTAGPLGITNDTHDIFMDVWGKKLALGKI